ncbi:hypothetical protein, partial [Raoultella ornithinolytica]|uniref:hypothetical protein n=1 Tax=Raoultella ornithinolytica TaxID=54291 RepID=UPI0013DB1F8D
LRGSDLITANVLPITTIDDGGTLYLDHSFNATQVQFAGGTGKLVLSNGFTGEILGFSGTGASFTQSDVIDLVGANY